MQNKLTKLTENLNSVLHQMASEKLAVEIWQPLNKDQKVVYNAKTIKFDNNEIFFASKTPIKDLEKEHETYCYIPQIQTVFKSHICFLSEFKLALQQPEYYVIRESRELQRKDYSQQNIKLSYHLGDPHSNMRKLFSHQAWLLNATDKGLAMGIPVQHLKRFYTGDRVTIKAKKGSKLAMIRHITPTGSNHYSIGLEYLS